MKQKKYLTRLRIILLSIKLPIFIYLLKEIRKPWSVGKVGVAVVGGAVDVLVI